MRFPNWLFRQHERTDWIGKLARYARADRRLPVDPIDIYDRIRSTSGGDAEMLHALHAALEEWNGGEPYRLDRDRGARRERERAAENAAYESELRAEAEKKRLAAALARRRRATDDRGATTQESQP
ncbi:hypothetical protein [Sphingomonas nostoxanthinifaciens]|uniref:hypothetical protein n=1 Tax=Sphingomonas nostoxanthinifaciens TaxID=2872652 RepID=UPI001CC1D906|nr:hypothetical protein [Sphingomonas nostoxanthinifaciens]UAK23700.1 hypothetical protein K8P63_15115 [Sphingomonas nostoxanthinifaciens]